MSMYFCYAHAQTVHIVVYLDNTLARLIIPERKEKQLIYEKSEAENEKKI